ncbi:MAG: peptidoglycan recognition family protein [Allomuricauda sp.]|jgi:N-acetyl-anhydromuramyl-L-alanine amidase AmpD|uniref:peptidoglycan recognition protein family protein n=1 Tax=Allomuricauda sp. ARW1Y1 TaxID=2663843 RepID=UPI0015C6B1F9|nr:MULTISPECIES: peptidoglycan recognition family protein [unclassified Allomuricauda]MBO6589314.1 N-acetylmuramoyl-L-alanine amidase [Allomuricauda sp.]MBO6618939.1 N-acetylmuramoyl-L-alanine amidase [Allomuricauda sp.]MBO6644851.1 N-acetylmuramoyl-L-alanine amidase [Allomuricauda sp.]MBO6746752.1 N-acetylmuramoyl-L-alanine amidase [Allomuricauda sp.]MBO6843165.1 N-acetylmuramoyl-L-alanine amidase [Allomuricauda sp.]
MKKTSLLLGLAALFVACSVQREIVDIPIIFDEQRMELTKEYLLNRYNLDQETPEITPKMVVLHWTAIPSLKKSFEAFNRSTLPNWRPDLENVSGLNVSSHFLVDQDGTIYRLMPETLMARHTIGLNHCAIGIENVGGTEGMPLTKAQLRSNIYLVNYLASKYDIDYVIGHQEYTLFENHPLWLEVDDGYRTEKTDPGMDFVEKVRKATKKFNFKPVPSKP